MRDMILRIYPNGKYTAGEFNTDRLTSKFPSLKGISSRNSFTRKRSYSFSANPVSSGRLLVPGSCCLYAGHLWEIQWIRQNEVCLATPCRTITNHVITSLQERCLRGEFQVISSLPLGLSEVSKLRILRETEILEGFQPQKKKRGSNGMTSRGRTVVENACFLLEQKYGRQNLSFLTLTVPKFNFPEDYCQIVEKWPYLIHRVTDWIKKKLKKAGIPTEYVYVNEIQEKRYEKFGVYAPHLHIVFVGRSPSRSGGWCISPQDVRQAWSKALSSVVSGPFETRAIENIQRVRKSCGAYMGKYMSKRSIKATDNPAIGTNGINQDIQGLPSWYGVSRTLLKGIRQATIRIGFYDAAGRIAWGILRKPAEYVKAGFLLFGSTKFIPISSANSTGDNREDKILSICVGHGTFASPASDIDWARIEKYTNQLLLGV
jgi:hypothetical protein